jgi:hypothetical protein
VLLLHFLLLSLLPWLLSSLPLLLSLLPQNLAALQQRQREFLVDQLGSPKAQQEAAQHLEQLVQQQQDAEEAAM